MDDIFGRNNTVEENEWISFSDLMAVMMVIFLFISIIYWDRVPKNTQQIIQQKLQIEKELLAIEKETAELREIKNDLESEKIKIEQDLNEVKRLRDKLDQEYSTLERQAENLRIDVEVAEKKAELADSVNRIFNEKIASFKNVELDIYEALQKEFQADLVTWNAEIFRENLIFRFKAPDVLFPSGSSKLTPRFEKILSNFIPRYVNVLQRFSDYIDEIRVEGHTSSEYSNQPTALGKYIANMGLSQDRTREVTNFALLSIDDQKRIWLQKLLTANGLSSSKLIEINGVEDRQNSRRVEFTVRTAIRKTLIELDELNK